VLDIRSDPSGGAAAEFDLAANPFHLLSAEPEDASERIAARLDDALFEESAPEADLERARQALVSPRLRLDAELRWCPELSAGRRQVFVDFILFRPFCEALPQIETVAGLTKANAAAHLCGRFPGEVEPIRALVAAWAKVDEGDVMRTLAESRRRAAAPAVDPGQFRAALADLRAAHVRGAVASLRRTRRPSAVTLELVEAAIAVDALGGLIDPVVRAYDATTEAVLSAIRERMNEEASAIRRQPDAASHGVETIVGLLREWDEINQPVQRLEQAQGHEEVRSAKLCGEMRDLALFLANEHDRHEEALALTKALLATFPELESIAARLGEDVGVLATIVARTGTEAQIGPLREAIAEAERRATEVRGELARRGEPKRRGALGRLLARLDELLAQGSPAAKAAGWDAVEGFAISLNNGLNDPQAALALLEHLAKRQAPTSELAQKLATDRRAAQRNALARELQTAVERPATAIEVIGRLLPLSEPEDAQRLRELRATLERRLQRGRMKTRLVLVLLAAGGFWWMFEGGAFDDLRRASAPSRVSAPVPSATLPTPPSATPRAAPAATPPSYPETIPPVGRDRVLSTAEIRYCLYQSERLNIIDARTDLSANVQAFNRLIDDYNARCGSFRYRAGALAPIEREVEQRRTVLRADAQRIIDSWRSGVRPAAPAPVAPAPIVQAPTAPTLETPSREVSLLDLGDREAARRVQRRLTALGYPTGGVDGVFGPRSEAALRAFKTAHPRLPADATWDLATQRELAP
jgi:hypothetical protein